MQLVLKTSGSIPSAPPRKAFQRWVTTERPHPAVGRGPGCCGGWPRLRSRLPESSPPRTVHRPKALVHLLRNWCSLFRPVKATTIMAVMDTTQASAGPGSAKHHLQPGRPPCRPRCAVGLFAEPHMGSHELLGTVLCVIRSVSCIPMLSNILRPASALQGPSALPGPWAWTGHCCASP